MLKKLLMVGACLMFSISGAFAQDKVEDYINFLKRSNSTHLNDVVQSQGLHLTYETNNGKKEACLHYFNAKGRNPSSGKICQPRKDVDLSMMGSPKFCPTNNANCNQASGSLTYVYCTHTNGTDIHLDIYYGPAGGYRMDRIEDAGSKPANCPN